MPRRFIPHVLSALALLLSGAAPGWAQDSLESAVKAAFLTKFPAFVDWPAGALNGRALELCVVGDDGVSNAVEQAVRGAGGGLRPLSVRRLPQVAPGSGCNILYAAGTSRQSAAQALDAVRGEPVLTVTDSARAASRGMIHFVVFENRVRFHIDAGAAGRAGLSISSKLMALGLSVKR